MLVRHASLKRRIVGGAVICACAYIGVSGSGLEAVARQVTAKQNATIQNPDSRLITASSMGPVGLNMTLEALRLMLPAASFERASDGDGAALIHVTFGPDDSVVLWADEDDPNAPIDWSRRVITISTFSETFHTVEGIRPGLRVSDVVQIFGPIQEVVASEIESREFITFERQPSWLTLRLDYAGIFSGTARRTKNVRPDAKILGVLISLYGG